MASGAHDTVAMGMMGMMMVGADIVSTNHASSIIDITFDSPTLGTPTVAHAIPSIIMHMTDGFFVGV